MSITEKIVEALKGQITLSGDVKRLTEAFRKAEDEWETERAALHEKNHELELRLTRLEEWKSLIMTFAAGRGGPTLPGG